MREKKVIAVIVEGPSEEAALGSILKEYFSSNTVQFVVVHGDITTREYSEVKNIISKIGKLINQIMERYGYHEKDFVEIIHIADTDGVFCKDVISEADVDEVHYYPDRIETRNPLYLKKMHTNKANILEKLYKTGKIKGIKYRIFFNSCNLEHVLWGELKNYTDAEKAEMADEIADRYEGNVDQFVDFISQEDIAVPGVYNETWKFIGKSNHSLERFTNMNLIFK